MKQPTLLAAPLFAVSLSPAVLHAQPAEEPAATPYADIRYRLELVDQEGVPEDATASTLRIKAGVKAGSWHGLSALVEGEAIMRIGPRHYNDTTNGLTRYPVVADPTDVLLNQAYVRFNPGKTVDAIAGRQVINLDNQRWIGSVGWRQNDQTFDAGRISVTPVAGLSAQYIHSWRVNRIFGPDSPQGIWRDSAINAVNIGYKLGEVGTLTGYGYWLDIPQAPAASSRTLGVRLAGQHPVAEGVKLLYAAEYAHQTDLSANPASFSLDYLALEPGVAFKGLTLKAGYERLEGNGAAALQTPLATLHAFNGWADVFLNTPANGLRDLYADAAYKFADGPLKGLLLRVAYHDFDSTVGNLDYGQEFDALVAYPLTKQIGISAKLARYNSDGFATDRTKAWFTLEAKF